MYTHLQQVRHELGRLVGSLHDAVPGTRFGIIAFGDYCDAATYVTKVLDLTDDDGRVRSFIDGVERTSGGDAPEAVEEALHAARGVSWRMNADRALVLVGDAPPHGVIDAPGQHESFVDELRARNQLPSAKERLYQQMEGSR